MNPNLSFSSRLLKTTLWILLLAGAVVVAVLYYPALKTHEPAPLVEEKITAVSDHPLLITLDEMEANDDSTGIIKLLYEQTDPALSPVLLSWLRAREGKGFTPYYYATARQLLVGGSPHEALLYYSTAGLMARIDAARCTDRSSAGWVAFLESGFSGVYDYMNANPESKHISGTWALEHEELQKNRPLPAWLCLKGEKPSAYVPYVAEELWVQERAEIRRAFENFTVSSEEPPQVNVAPAAANE